MKKKHDDSAEKNVPVADANGKQHFKLIPQLKVIFGSWINILLIAVPIGFVSNYIHGFPPSAVFVINFLAIVPLAALLSFATEEIALRVGETLGGLLNATFGNAVELIVSVIALTKNEIVIVQTSLVGSILSNLLLVMGMSFFFGGLTRVEQFFNVTVAQTAASLLTLAIGSLIIPAAFNIFNGPSNYGVIEISRGTSIILLSVYGCYLFFQLKTHAMIFNDPSQKAPKRKNLRKNPEGKTIITGDYAKQHTDAAGGVGPIPEESTANTSSSPNDPIESGSTGSAEQDNREPASISLIAAIVTLGIATVLIAFTAEFMVGSIDDITNGGKISKTFVGLILLPIVGNAAEHVTAVTVACKDKMDLAIGVAVGSSMQIALLVIPFVVVLGWILNKPAMSLGWFITCPHRHSITTDTCDRFRRFPSRRSLCINSPR